MVEETIKKHGNRSAAKMPKSSPLINKAFRKYVSPVLLGFDFNKVDGRNGWAWKEYATLVFHIGAVGSHFSDVTGWPPSSVCVWLGVNYSFIPSLGITKLDHAGRILPREYECHMRSHLERMINQDYLVKPLINRVERKRLDIWWVNPDGSNSMEVAMDIAKSFETRGIKWYNKCIDLESALQLVEKEHDCFIKYVRAAYIAKQVGNTSKYEKYRKLAEDEGKRIGRIPDNKQWFATYS